MTLSSGKQTNLHSFFSFLPVLAGVLAAATHIALVYLSGDKSLLPLTLMFWISAGLLVWQKRHKLVLQRDTLSQLAGIVILGLFFATGIYQAQVLGKEVSWPAERFLAAAPFVAAIGVGLLSTRWRYLGQYRAELILLFFFGMPKALLWTAIDLRITTARFSTAILNLLEQDAIREGTIIALPTGSVDVIKDCSGLNGIFYLIAMATLLLVMMPLQGTRKYIVPFLAVVIAFLMNGARVAFLAILYADPDPTKFQRYHGNSGFSLGALVIFCAVYCLLYWQENHFRLQR